MQPSRGHVDPKEGAAARGSSVPGVELERPRPPEDAFVAARHARRRSVTPSTIAAVLVVTAPALLLRLWALDALGLNSDEAVYAGQAASLAGEDAFLPHFPVFRAHPLVFQSLLSVQYRILGVSPIGGRLLAVAFGMATIWVTYAIG